MSRVLGPVVSPEILTLIQEQMQRLADAESGGLLTFGVLGALWSSSAALVSIVSALNRAYDIEESRPWWKVRLVALGLTIGLATFILAALTLVLAGPTIATYLDERLGMGSALRWTWLILQWPVALALVATALGLVFYFGPDAEQDWAWITPGALIGAVLWLLVSLATKVYVANFSDYNAAYGSVGGVMVLLLWLYLSGVAVLVAAELNAEIEHASPYGKAPGQKTADGRRALGTRAERLFKEKPPQPAAPEGNTRRLGAGRRPVAIRSAGAGDAGNGAGGGRRCRHPRRPRLDWAARARGRLRRTPRVAPRGSSARPSAPAPCLPSRATPSP